MRRVTFSTLLLTVQLAMLASASAQPSALELVPMRDGVVLTTDVYLPGAGAEWPVVLIRTPYGRGAMQSLAEQFRGRSMAVVVQDMRGRSGSGGVDCVFRCDGDGTLSDGADTIAWIEAQPWSDGHLAIWGGSAVGIVDYLVAPAAPGQIDAMWVLAGTPSVYDHMFFQGGAFRQILIETWLADQGSTFFLGELAAHPLADASWDPVQTESRFPVVDTPVVHVGGWFDIFSQGTLDAFTGYHRRGATGAAGAQKLIMGPWTHTLFTTTAGAHAFPANSADIPGGVGPLFWLWFDHYLGIRPAEAEIDAIPAVQYYVMGDVTDPSAPGNEWRTADDWPIPAAPIRWHLQAEGALAEACPADDEEASSYRYDPADPSPTLGGANLMVPGGPQDQSLLEVRRDVVVFTSPVLARPLEITGRVRAHLWVSIDTPDTDLMVRLTDVYPDGRSMLIVDGAQRLASRGSNDSLEPLSPGEIVEAVVDLWSTSIVLDEGHRLRVSITSSNAPRFRPNPNDGSSYGEPSTPRPVTVTLHRGAETASYIELPDPSRDPSEVRRCGVAGGGSDAGPGPSDGGPSDGGPSDGGPSDGGLSDGGSRGDSGRGDDSGIGAAEDGGGRPPSLASDGGCSCRVGMARERHELWLAVGVALFLLRSRRRF